MPINFNRPIDKQFLSQIAEQNKCATQQSSASECGKATAQKNVSGIRKPSAVNVRQAGFADIPALMALSLESAMETASAKLYEPEHNRRHLADILAHGVGFVAEIQGEVIGAALFTPIDTGFAVLPHLESQHIFIRSDCRSYRTISALFRSMREYANRHQIQILVHQVAYFDALAGDRTQTERVERLYRKIFGADGSYGITYVCRPEQSIAA